MYSLTLALEGFQYWKGGGGGGQNLSIDSIIGGLVEGPQAIFNIIGGGAGPCSPPVPTPMLKSINHTLR